jgi:FkbM family methyltransferase
MAAVEPNPPTFQYLKQNLACLDIQMFQVALGDGQPVGFSAPRNSGSVQTQSNPDPSRCVSPSCGFLALLESLKNAGVDADLGTFMKVDCEGGELHIIREPTSAALVANYSGFAMEYHIQGDTFPNGVPEAELYDWFARVRAEGATTRIDRKSKDTGLFRTYP